MCTQNNLHFIPIDDVKFCVEQCEATTFCGPVEIPEDHLKVHNFLFSILSHIYILLGYSFVANAIIMDFLTVKPSVLTVKGLQMQTLFCMWLQILLIHVDLLAVYLLLLVHVSWKLLWTGELHNG